MNFVQAIQSAFKNYVKFDGRASRSEYWWFALFQILVLIIPDVLMQGEIRNGTPASSPAFTSSSRWPSSCRPWGSASARLHDTDRSAWWLLIALIPLIGAIVLLVFMCLKGTSGPNKFGADPLGGNPAAVF
ncbi:MAG: DUF805 domain-containing protein [Asticcacaulis sp.]